MTKIAINGFGRIGRLAFRKVFDDPSMDLDVSDVSHSERYSMIRSVR